MSTHDPFSFKQLLYTVNGILYELQIYFAINILTHESLGLYYCHQLYTY